MNEDIKKALSDYWYVLETIKELNKSINELKESLECQRELSAQRYGSGIGGSRIKDATLDAVIKIIELYEDQILINSKKLERLLKLKNEIESMLDLLNGDERKIVEYKYFKRLRWYQVARLTNFSESHTRLLHDRGLKKIDKKYREKRL